MQKESGRLDRRKIRIAARGAQERRRHTRVPLQLHGRFWSETMGEHACALLDISPGGARVMSRTAPAVNAVIVLMITSIGLSEGTSVRGEG
jgi:hypothetical protein